MNESTRCPSSHFGEKDALTHVIERRAEGIAAFSEAHGTEIPGHLSAGADAARETALCLLLIGILTINFGATPLASLFILISFGLAWTLWKTGRSGWLAWSRLERLHRIIEQEKFEIENNREQEREELKVLYRAKGFEGKLLDDVIHVLMADGDRLLKVMLEEELGLTLENHEHPLKQALGAGLGAAFALLVTIAAFFVSPLYGIVFSSFLIISMGAATSAKYEGNRIVSAIIWNLSLASLGLGFIYFISQFLKQLL